MKPGRRRLGPVLLGALLSGALVGAVPGVASAATAQCLHEPAPSPASGGAVFALPFDAKAQTPNVVVIPAGSSWTGGGSCAGSESAAAQIMTHPTSIAVGAGGAVLLADKGTGLFSAWGAKDTTGGDPAPVLFPGRTDFKTTEAQVVDQEYLLEVFNSCRSCSLAGVQFTPTQGFFSTVAYEGDVSGSNLSGAVLGGAFQGWKLEGTDLSGATFDHASLAGSVLDHTIVDATVFDGTDLRGARLDALRYRSPPRFSGVRVGPFGGVCTTFRDTDLVGAGLTASATDPGCETSPLFPDSSVPLSVISSLVRDHSGRVDLADAAIVSVAGDRSQLAGADLSAINLDGARFVGFPVDLAGTKFDHASLKHTSFELADLPHATFHDADMTGASFLDANLARANFGGSQTVLEDADLVGADLSGAGFVGADLSAAVLSRALAVDADFNGVRAPNAAFNGAHIYGDGQAFDNATDLRGADFSKAVMGGDVDLGGGFDLTHADLAGAKFDGAQCIGCNFTGSTLTGVNFTGAELPGAIFSGALTLSGANLVDAWLYCGDESNSACPTVPGSQPRWSWPLLLGSREAYGPVPFATTNLTGVSLSDVAVCPSGKDGAITPAGCQGNLLPDPAHAPPIPAGCSAAGSDACPTPTSTMLDAGGIGEPLAVAPATPPTWASSLSGRGYEAAFDDGTVRQFGDGPTRVIAGRAGEHCASSTATCGDGGAATGALLGTPAGLATGLDGSLYVADPALHRVRRIDPAGKISTVAGTGRACAPAPADCGDGGPATEAALAGPDGVWVDPAGKVYIADGSRGMREVLRDGTISTVATGHDMRSVVGDLRGNLFAAAHDPDGLLRIELATGKLTTVVGTGTSGYNGNTNSLGMLLPGPSVQVNDPEGLSMARDGNVLFADAKNNLIRAYVPSSGHVIDALGGLVVNGVPQGGFNGDGRWGDETELNDPRSVTATRAGLYVVADTANTRIRQWGPNPPVDRARRGQLERPTPCTLTVTTGRPGAARPASRCDTDHLRRPLAARDGARVLATITRGPTMYATGRILIAGAERERLALTELRPLRAGRYVLTLRRHRPDDRIALRRVTIAISDHPRPAAERRHATS